MTAGLIFGQGTFEETAVLSATTCDIGVPTTVRVAITGTTTITSFGTRAWAIRLIRFTGALILTHNATSLILPGGVNITTSAGDTCMAMSDASGNWRVYDYSFAIGARVSGPVTVTSNDAAALAVGRLGSTNPALQVDASASNVVTGIKITGAAAAGGADLSVISSGTNENLTINAKGSGTITLGGTSIGNTIINGSLLLTGTATRVLFNSGGGSVGAVGGNAHKTVAANAALGLSVGFGIIVYRDQVNAGFAVVAAGDGAASILYQTGTNFTQTDPGSGGNKWYVASSGDVTNRYSTSGSIAYSMLSAAFPSFV